MIGGTLRAQAKALRAQADTLDALAAAAERDEPDEPVEALPALLDRAQLARQIGVSCGTVDRLRREGLPALLVGDAPRFQLDRVLAWLAARSEPAGLRAIEGGRR